MEEKQIQEFVSRTLNDEKLFAELKQDPETVLMREQFSPRVTQVLRKLIPQMGLERAVTPPSLLWGG